MRRLSHSKIKFRLISCRPRWILTLLIFKLLTNIKSSFSILKRVVCSWTRIVFHYRNIFAPRIMAKWDYWSVFFQNSYTRIIFIWWWWFSFSSSVEPLFFMSKRIPSLLLYNCAKFSCISTWAWWKSMSLCLWSSWNHTYCRSFFPNKRSCFVFSRSWNNSLSYWCFTSFVFSKFTSSLLKYCYFW